MICYHDQVKKKDLGNGIVVQELGYGTGMSVLHWDMADQSVVKMHSHPHEQFGYVIKGGFEVVIGEQTSVLKSGDAYFIPPNVPHEFKTIGQTEAIDVFHPVRRDLPWT